MMIDKSSVRNWTATRLVVEIVEVDRNNIDLLPEYYIRGCFELVGIPVEFSSAVQKRREQIRGDKAVDKKGVSQ